MFKKLKELNLHILMTVFFLGLFLGVNVSYLASAREPAHQYLDYFHRVYQILRSEYVEVPDTKKLFYGAIRGMIGAMDDPFSRFLDEKALQQLKEMTTGKFVGVGIEITVRDGEIVVISPIDNSPAMSAGILAGDVIKKVNDTVIRDKKLTEIVKMIKGLPKSKVKLYIEREGYDELLEFDVERAPIKIKSVASGIIPNGNVGYIKVKNFGSDTTTDVRKAIEGFNKKNVQRIIMDLRYNPGGLLTAAVEMSDLFLDKGKVIVSTRGRKGTRNERVFKAVNPSLAKGELIVLVNGGSASASEIFAGAMRDNKRGMLLGVKTFGKGSVQKSFSLDENVGVAVTIARYYTPSGEMIHRKGIKPNYSVKPKKLNDADKKAVKEISRLKILDSFVSKKTTFSSETRRAFKKLLKDKKIIVSGRTADLMLKNQLMRYKKRSLYDLEFDVQLMTALEKLKSGSK